MRRTPVPMAAVAAAAAITVFGVAGSLSCQGGDAPYARAVVIESLDRAIGGPTANARAGDYLLENDQIKVVIEQGKISHHPADVGGTLIDMDLNRPEQGFRRGNGLDQLGQIASIANLSTSQAKAAPHVRITRSRDGAEVTTSTDAEPIFRILLALTLLLEQRFVDELPRFRMYTEYELRPGERLVRVRTTVGFDVAFCPVTEADGCNAECDDALYDDDCECPQVPARCDQGVRVRDADPLPDRPQASILDIVLGDLPRPLGAGTCADDSECSAARSETCVPVTSSVGGEFKVCRGPAERDSGVFFGDLLIFGGNLHPFIPGTGYDTETDIRRLFDRGEDTLARPLEIDHVVATGDRVSYGYSSPDGQILVPIFEGPFAMGATHAASCASSEPGCLSGVLSRFERWVSVGTGDPASAEEPIARALGRPLGTVSGVVTRSPSQEPMSGVSVYVLADPRGLACDAQCEAVCLLPPGEPETWTLEQLITANRCRTRSDLFADGTAAVVTYALSDPGTDPVHDGDYRMALPPGRYVLVAVDEHRARSPLRAVEVASGQAVRAALSMPEAGHFDYAIFDESGALIPGKVSIGHCLPGAPCASDSECVQGELCQAGACGCPWDTLLPVELGGPRPRDGVLVVDTTASGKGRVELPPGEYELVFSRGPHYSIDRQTVIIEQRVATQVHASLRRVVDRRDWIAADFHVHSTNSMDSGIPLASRVTGFLAEDMDFLSSTDHDWLTRYEYLIQDMGASEQLGSQVGAEITTQEYGHYIAFPLRHRGYAGGERLTSNGAVQWRGLGPQGIMDKARELFVGDLPVLIDIPHPYDYFEYYQLDAITLEPTESLLAALNTMLNPAFFSGDFDVMELVNSKSYSRFRRPTLGEVRAYGQALDALTARLRAGEIDSQTYSRGAYDLSMSSVRERAERTPAEQDAFWAGQGNDVSCYCGADGDCAAGLVCQQSTMSCVLPPGSDDPAPPADWLCRRYRGVMDDWFTMLNRGVFRTGVSGSDVHGGETGSMRTLLRTSGTTPPYLTDADVVDALQNGRAIVSNGPMIHFTVNQAEVGDMLPLSGASEVTLKLRVEKAGWYDVDRVELYRNGELIHWFIGCERSRGAADPHGHPCIDTSDGVVVALDQTLSDRPAEDSWYVAMAYGLDGRSMAPVYGSVVLASLGVPEITQRIYDIIPRLREFRNPRFPSLHPLFPFAFTNPIWVDVGGDGWLPPLEPLAWCRAGDFGCPRNP